MSEYFPKWISPRLFIVALVLSAIPATKSAFEGGLTTEGVVFAIVQTGFGGLFWGFVLTWIQRLFKKTP